jgi:hypothetical protein
MSMQHRQEARKGAREAATVTILGHPDVPVPCEIVNFSPSGMGITVQREIPLGSAVKVDWDRRFLVGRVRRVSMEDADYHVGLELLYCSRWDPAEVEAAAVAG